jgi:hypothetical protein
MGRLNEKALALLGSSSLSAFACSNVGAKRLAAVPSERGHARRPTSAPGRHAGVVTGAPPGAVAELVGGFGELAITDPAAEIHKAHLVVVAAMPSWSSLAGGARGTR